MDTYKQQSEKQKLDSLDNKHHLHNQDVSMERYYGYTNQKEYQKDLKAYYNEGICGALNKRGKFCRLQPMENGRCLHHGGRAKQGLQNHNTKHGRYSKYLPKQVLQRYEDALSDDDLLDLKQEIALITSRIYELAEKMNDTAGKRNYMELLKLYENYKDKKRAGSEDTAFALAQFEAMLVSIKEDLMIWEEVDDMITSKRKLVDSEFKKMKTMDQFVEVEKVMLLMGGLMDICVKEIEKLEGVLVDDAMIEKTTTTIARKFKNISSKG